MATREAPPGAATDDAPRTAVEDIVANYRRLAARAERVCDEASARLRALPEPAPAPPRGEWSAKDRAVLSLLVLGAAAFSAALAARVSAGPQHCDFLSPWLAAAGAALLTPVCATVLYDMLMKVDLPVIPGHWEAFGARYDPRLASDAVSGTRAEVGHCAEWALSVRDTATVSALCAASDPAVRAAERLLEGNRSVRMLERRWDAIKRRLEGRAGDKV